MANEPAYVDDPTCRDVYVDTVLMAAAPGPAGIVRLEFQAYHFSNSNPVQADRFSPVARMAMTKDVALMLYNTLIPLFGAPDKGQGTGRSAPRGN